MLAGSSPGGEQEQDQAEHERRHGEPEPPGEATDERQVPEVPPRLEVVDAAADGGTLLDQRRLPADDISSDPRARAQHDRAVEHDDVLGRRSR